MKVNIIIYFQRNNKKIKHDNLSAIVTVTETKYLLKICDGTSNLSKDTYWPFCFCGIKKCLNIG